MCPRLLVCACTWVCTQIRYTHVCEPVCVSYREDKISGCYPGCSSTELCLIARCREPTWGPPGADRWAAYWSHEPCYLRYADKPSIYLTHWGRVTHLCVGKLTSIASDNGLSPGRRQAIIWTNAGIFLIGTLGTNFSEILIKINTFSFQKMRLKVSSAKWRQCCLGLNVLSSVSMCSTFVMYMNTQIHATFRPECIQLFARIINCTVVRETNQN